MMMSRWSGRFLIRLQIDGRFSLRSDEASIRVWALVLTARFIPCRIEHDQNGWQLLIPADLMVKAIEELRAFEEKNRNWPPVASALSVNEGKQSLNPFGSSSCWQPFTI